MTQLDQLLAKVGPALKAGDFDSLILISAMLETVLLPSDPDLLHRAGKLARQNEALLQATAKGLRAAHRRIAALKSGSRLTTYDGSGHKREHPAQPERSHRL